MSGTFATYLLARGARAAVTVWGVTTLVFFMVHFIPGDPIDAILGEQAAPEDRAALRTALRLDAPLIDQYAAFMGDVVDGTLGHSFRSSDRTVLSMIGEALPHTAALSLASIGLALALALPLGVLAALYHGRPLDRIVTTFASLGIAIPNIWLGPLLVLCFGVTLRILPLPGDSRTGGLALVLPAFTVGTAMLAILMRQTRTGLLEVLSETYMRAARARGLSQMAVLWKHGLRNALLPVVTVAGAQLGALLSGAVITERIFERPGLGQLFLDAFFDRDIPVVQGCVLAIALVYVTVNLLIDLLYGVIDPRVRLS